MDKLLTLQQAAEILGCSTHKIYGLQRSGLLEMKKIGARSTRITEESVRRLLADPQIVKQSRDPQRSSPPVAPIERTLHHRLRIPAAAKYIGITEAALYMMRHRGDGPAYIKIGTRILYDTRELDAWLTRNTHGSTELEQAG